MPVFDTDVGYIAAISPLSDVPGFTRTSIFTPKAMWSSDKKNYVSDKKYMFHLVSMTFMSIDIGIIYVL